MMMIGLDKKFEGMYHLTCKGKYGDAFSINNYFVCMFKVKWKNEAPTFHLDYFDESA